MREIRRRLPLSKMVRCKDLEGWCMSSLTFSKMLNTQERKKSPFLVKGVHIRTCPFFSGGRGALLRSKGRLRNIWYTPLFMEHKTKHKTAITQSRFRSLFLSSYSSLLFFFYSLCYLICTPRNITKCLWVCCGSFSLATGICGGGGSSLHIFDLLLLAVGITAVALFLPFDSFRLHVRCPQGEVVP